LAHTPRHPAYALGVLILLPPSESKTGRIRGRPANPERLSFPELAPTRAAVAGVLAMVSGHPDAPTLLGVSANLHADIAHNTRLGSAPAVPVADLYTGVLYDALDLPSMDAAARRRANRWLVVVSALYGALRPADKVPPIPSVHGREPRRARPPGLRMAGAARHRPPHSPQGLA